MPTITLDVSEELAARLGPVRKHLPQLLQRVLGAYRTDPPPAQSLAFSEVVEFLASSPTPADILAFRLSPAAQDRLEELLDKNREGELTPAEAAELDSFQQLNHLFILLKARARACVS